MATYVGRKLLLLLLVLGGAAIYMYFYSYVIYTAETTRAVPSSMKEQIQTLVSPYIDPKLHTVNRISSKRSSNKTILFWNPPVWFPKPGSLDMTNCEYKNCKFSVNVSDMDKSDVVVFNIGDGPKIKSTPPVLSHKRNPNQAWIFFSLESPYLTHKPSPAWDNAFNWSWTYRTDSDIFGFYGWLRTKPDIPTRNYSDIFKNKSRHVAWVVSNCKTKSRREEYVRTLQKYVAVDIYGKCGKNKQRALKNITDIIGKDYKFYLGFENAFCKDYFTDKFFYYFRYDTINVLRGLVNYSSYLPVHAFIDTKDFSSIKALGQYLNKLSQNEEEYIKYLKIKDQYEVMGDIYREGFKDDGYKEGLCHICDKINNLEENRKIIHNVGKWLGTCVTPNDLVDK